MIYYISFDMHLALTTGGGGGKSVPRHWDSL